MPKKTFIPEQGGVRLRQVEVLMQAGQANSFGLLSLTIWVLKKWIHSADARQ